MTWGEFQDCIDGFNEKLNRERKENDALNHLLGKYIGFAFNDVKHYPKEPYLSKLDEREKMVASTDEDRVKMARLKYKKG